LVQLLCKAMLDPFPCTPEHELLMEEQDHAAAWETHKRRRAEGASFHFMRQDVLTGKWALYNGGVSRISKPMQVKRQKRTEMPRVGDEPESLEGCPFCAGDVSSNLESVSKACPRLGDVLRYEDQKGKIEAVEDWSLAGSTGNTWRVRVVRNLFPSLCLPRSFYIYDGCNEGFQADHGDEMNPHRDNPWYREVSAVGYNEIIIETPRHNSCLALENETNVSLLIRAMLRRGNRLRMQSNVKYITFFKQHKCGSLIHSHTQVITTPCVPHILDNIATRAHHFHKRYSKCCVCSILVEGPLSNTMASERLVFASKHFVVAVPFAAREPHRMLIAPRRHDKHFLNLLDEEAVDLANVLRRATALYYHFLDDAPFHLAWFTCPVHLDSREAELYDEAFHWYMGLYPRLKTRVRGLQSATDIAENELLPEDNAAQLRRWLAELEGRP